MVKRYLKIFLNLYKTRPKMNKKSTQFSEIKDKLDQLRQAINEDKGNGFKEAQLTEDPISTIIANMGSVNNIELKEPYIL